jgi:hypothetical protein
VLAGNGLNRFGSILLSIASTLGVLILQLAVANGK